MIYYNDYDLPECNSVLGKSIPDLPPPPPSMNCILAFSAPKDRAVVMPLSFYSGVCRCKGLLSRLWIAIHKHPPLKQ